MGRKTGKSNRGSGQDDYRAKMRKDAKNRKTKSFSVLSVPDDTPFFKPKKGWNNLDVIPYKVSIDNHQQADKGDLWPRKIFGIHRNVGPEDKTFACPKETNGDACPICEEYLKQKSSGDSEIAKVLKAKKRELYNVIDLDSKENKETIQLFEGSYYNFGTLLDEEVNDSEEGSIEETYGMLEGGATIAVKFREETFDGHPYKEAAKIEFEERDNYGEEWTDDALDLDAIIDVPTYDELYEAFWDTERDSDSDGDSGRARGRSRSRGRDRDSEDEPTKDDEDTGRKRGRGRGKQSQDEDTETETEPECPHGGEYGVDADDLAECEDCDFWTNCSAIKEGKQKSDKEDTKKDTGRGSKKKGGKDKDKDSGRRRRRN